MLTSNELRHLRKHLLANANVEHIDLESNEIESLRPMLCDASGAPCDRLSRLRHLNVKKMHFEHGLPWRSRHAVS